MHVEQIRVSHVFDQLCCHAFRRIFGIFLPEFFYKFGSIVRLLSVDVFSMEQTEDKSSIFATGSAMIFCHCPFVEFFQRNRLVFMVEFQKLHLNKMLRDGLPRLWHSDFLFSITKQWKASPKSSIVKSPQRNNQTGSTFPLPMKRIPPFRLVGKRFYDPNAPPYKAVFRITTDFIWRILLCMKNI